MMSPTSRIVRGSEPTDRDREAPIVELDDFGAVSAEAFEQLRSAAVKEG